jgi:hypothetical protein
VKGQCALKRPNLIRGREHLSDDHGASAFSPENIEVMNVFIDRFAAGKGKIAVHQHKMESYFQLQTSKACKRVFQELTRYFSGT